MEITTQPKNNNLDYLIDPEFRNIDRLFVLSFGNGDNNPMRDSFDKYYMPLVEIKGFNVLIYNKQFFDQPVKKKRSVWKTFLNVKKWIVYNRKLIRLFLASKIL